jgi:hypothetical protein
MKTNNSVSPLTEGVHNWVLLSIPKHFGLLHKENQKPKAEGENYRCTSESSFSHKYWYSATYLIETLSLVSLRTLSEHFHLGSESWHLFSCYLLLLLCCASQWQQILLDSRRHSPLCNPQENPPHNPVVNPQVSPRFILRDNLLPILPGNPLGSPLGSRHLNQRPSPQANPHWTPPGSPRWTPLDRYVFVPSCDVRSYAPHVT